MSRFMVKNKLFDSQFERCHVNWNMESKFIVKERQLVCSKKEIISIYIRSHA